MRTRFGSSAVRASPKTRFGATLLTAMLAFAAAVAPVAQGASATDVIASLNAQRAANGIPAGITENTTWSENCRLHVRYVELNGGTDFSNPHTEDPSKPGYTEGGRHAAEHAVLGGTWSGTQNPYENAPIHLSQLLGPGLAQTGYYDGCMYTWPGYTRAVPAESQLFTYPGQGAAIYPSLKAYEWPFVPGDFVGLPQGTTTGPHLYVFAFGGTNTRGRLSDVSLNGPEGALDARSVDNFTQGSQGNLGQYLPPGGIIIPAQPLKPSASYTAHATFTPEQGAPVSKTWSFTTTGTPTPDPGTGGGTGGGTDPGTGGGTGGGGTGGEGTGGGGTGGLPGLPGTPGVAAAGGITSWTEHSESHSEAHSTSESSTETEEVETQPAGIRATVSRAALKLRAGAAAGRTARVTVQRLRKRCTRSRCSYRPTGRKTTRTVTLGAGVTTVRLPNRPCRVTVTVGAFTKSDVEYDATRITRTVK